MTPNFFYVSYTLLTLAMLVVGGKSVAGALVGVVVITAGSEATRYLASDTRSPASTSCSWKRLTCSP